MVLLDKSMKHLIVYQIKYKKSDSFKFSNFQYTTEINVKTRTRFILHEIFLLLINQVTVCSCSGIKSLKNSDNETSFSSAWISVTSHLRYGHFEPACKLWSFCQPIFAFSEVASKSR